MLSSSHSDLLFGPFSLLLRDFCICCSCCLGASLSLIPLVNSHLSFKTPFKVTNSLLAFQIKAPTLSSNGSSFHSLVTQTIQNLPAIQKTQVLSLGREDPLEKEMTTHSNTLAWRIHGQKRLVGYSPWGHKESDTT